MQWECASKSPPHTTTASAILREGYEVKSKRKRRGENRDASKLGNILPIKCKSGSCKKRVSKGDIVKKKKEGER